MAENGEKTSDERLKFITESPYVCASEEERNLAADLLSTRKELDQLRADAAKIHPRIWKLVRKGEYFIIIGKHEPYFVQAYGLIREQEMKQGTWSESDELTYQKNTAREE
jgi:hypothetical protein